MKKLLFLFVGFLIVNQGLFADWQWDNDLQLSPDSGRAEKIWYSGYSIAIDKLCRVHAVWSNDREGNNEIYYRRSLDQGQNWEPEVRLTDTGINNFFPAIAVDTSGYVHIIYWEGDGWHMPLYYQRSTDGGTTWDPRIELSSVYWGLDCPSIAVDKNMGVHVAWTNNIASGDTFRIMYKRSTDQGTTWFPEEVIDSTAGTIDPLLPSIATDNLGKVHIMWQIYDYALEEEYIFYARSSDGGATWESPTNLGLANSGYCNFKIIATNDQNTVIVACTDGTRRVYMRRSINGGNSWADWTQLTSGSWPSQSQSGSFAFFPEGNTVYFTWSQYNISTYLGTINYKVSTDGGETWSASALVSESDSTRFPCVAVFGSDTDSSVHFTWLDMRSGLFDYKFYYKRCYLATGVTEQISLITDEIIKVFPNPSRADIYFIIPQSFNYSTLKIFDISGRNVRNLPLVNHSKKPISIKWNGTNDYGNKVPPGLYFAHFGGENKNIVKKIIFLR